MRRLMLLLVGSLALAGVAVASSGGATQVQPRWVITDLGTLGGNWSEAVAINERGEVVGHAETTGRLGVDHAFVWRSGRIVDLGALRRGWESDAVDISNRGQIVGQSFDARGDYRRRAVIWEKGKITDLGTLGGPDSAANAVNDQAQVVGVAETKTRDKYGDPLRHAFLWQNGKMTDLTKTLSQESEAQAINAQGQVAGRIAITTGFLWAKGRMSSLEVAPSWPDWGWPRANALNDRGQVIGFVDRGSTAAAWERGRTLDLESLVKRGRCSANDINEHGIVAGSCAAGRPSNLARPCIWQEGKVRALRLAFGDRGMASGLNDRGQVIGASRAGSGPFHAFVWQSGKMTDLGALPGGRQSMATAINERGQIVGWSATRRGSRHAVLWTLKR